MPNKKLVLVSILNSLGALAYIVLVVLFLNNAQSIFGKADNFFAGVIMLTLFVLSALITSLLILGRPAMLYFDGQKKQGVELLLYTVLILVILFALVVLAYLGLR